MDTDLPVRNLIVNHPRRAVWEGLLASFQPAARPPDLNFEWRIEGQRILFQFSPWGNIGFLTLKDLIPSRMEILFYPPPFPTQQETEQLEFAIRAEILDNRPTYDDLHNSRETGLNYLAQRLYHHKQSLLVRIRHWLAQALGIWGLIEERSTPYDFSFVIDGTPAQFAVMLRYFFQTYRPPDYRRDVEVIVMRSDHWQLREIPQKVGSSEKTILNRIIELRKQFGSQIVPYRKVLKTKAKDKGK